MNWPSQHLSEGGEQNKSYPFSQMESVSQHVLCAQMKLHELSNYMKRGEVKRGGVGVREWIVRSGARGTRFSTGASVTYRGSAFGNHPVQPITTMQVVTKMTVRTSPHRYCHVSLFPLPSLFPPPSLRPLKFPLSPSLPSFHCPLISTPLPSVTPPRSLPLSLPLSSG